MKIKNNEILSNSRDWVTIALLISNSVYLFLPRNNEPPKRNATLDIIVRNTIAILAVRAAIYYMKYPYTRFICRQSADGYMNRA